MKHGAIGSALTASFDKACVFNKQEVPKVSPTRIRSACAAVGCMEEGIESGFFAQHFMEKEKETTNFNYNLYANYREALKLSMMIGDTFEIGGIEQKAAKQDIEKLTTAIIDSEKNVSSKEEILKFFEKLAWITTRWFKYKRYPQNQIQQSVLQHFINPLPHQPSGSLYRLVVIID